MSDVKDPISNILEAGKHYLDAISKTHKKTETLIDLGSNEMVLALGYAFSMAAYAAVCTVVGATKGAEEQ